ncbi:unnamed protein product [Bursaphelenchus okinawaensis]|uniref:Receptor protein-tyrosine kinase n=1 Tax=Bursaphelenchus okinawaensis TaxID=465554 RepID=A0A811L8W9_9BILA|nr:unnamed protein product [Bursaphelenchus okinawaensis]CAG9121250.1 unnamed protein product [Bursaphelenchus okinawaensis]
MLINSWPKLFTWLFLANQLQVLVADVELKPDRKSEYELALNGVCSSLIIKFDIDEFREKYKDEATNVFKGILSEQSGAGFWKNEIARAYANALAGSILAFSQSDCRFINGDMHIDWVHPFSFGLSTMLRHVYVVTGTLSGFAAAASGRGRIDLTGINRVMNRDNKPYSIDFDLMRKEGENILQLMMFEMYQGMWVGGKLHVSEYVLTDSNTLKKGTVMDAALTKNVNARGVQIQYNRLSGYSVNHIAIGDSSCANGNLPDKTCCPEKCKLGCFSTSKGVGCSSCPEGSYWNHGSEDCVTCNNENILDQFCVAGEKSQCPPPLVQIGNTCSYTCPAGTSISESMDEIRKNKVSTVPVCKPCSYTFSRSDFTFPRAKTCAKTCTHTGLLTLFNGLEDCKILIGNVIINQWTMGQRTSLEMNERFIKFFDQFQQIYGNVIVHDLLNVVTFDYFRNLRGVEGTLSFLDNDMLAHLPLNSMSTGGIANLTLKRNHRLNVAARKNFINRVVRGKKQIWYNMKPTTYQGFGASVEEMYDNYATLTYPTYDVISCPSNTPFVVKDPKGKNTCKKDIPTPDGSCSETCDGGCVDNGQTSWHCAKCKALEVDAVNVQTCVGEQCPVGYFKDGKKCRRCHRNCISCTKYTDTHGKECSCQLVYLNVNHTLACFPFISSHSGMGEDAFTTVIHNILSFEDEKL